MSHTQEEGASTGRQKGERHDSVGSSAFRLSRAYFLQTTEPCRAAMLLVDHFKRDRRGGVRLSFSQRLNSKTTTGGARRVLSRLLRALPASSAASRSLRGQQGQCSTRLRARFRNCTRSCARRLRQKHFGVGRQEGRQEGERVLLRRLLTQRFGPLPEGVEQRLHSATVQDLERWADRVLDAQRLDEVFRDV